MKQNTIEIKIPLNKKWLNIGEKIIKLYALNVGFNDTLCNMMAGSIDEVCGKLYERASESEREETFLLTIDSDEDVVTTSITYNKEIPLNPHKDKLYEVPDNINDLDDSMIDALWLFLVKRRMDRVYFVVNGSKQSLRMMKYRRETGKEKRLWVMELKPKLKSNLNIDDNGGDEMKYAGFIQDFKSSSILRLGRSEMHAVKMMDGKHSIYDIYMDAVEKEYPASPKLYTTLYEALEKNNLLYKEREKKSFLEKFKAFMSNLTFSIPKADKVVTKFYTIFKPFYTKIGVLLSIIVGLSALYPLFTSLNKMTTLYNNAFDILVKNLWIIIVYYLINNLITVIHELSHGAACKKYGGNVPRVGATFYLSSFIFFCDTTSSYNFPKKIQRIIVSLAGPISTLLFFGITSWAFFFSNSQEWSLIWLVASISSLFGLIMNFNPFLRMDSYYILSDITGINNLREKSFSYFGDKFKRMIGLPCSSIKSSKRDSIIFIIYAIFGGSMMALFFLLPIIRGISYLLKEGNSSVKIFWLAIILLIIGYQSLSYLFEKIRNIKHYEKKLS